jgi:NADH-quinone oxidoreductase subunit N
MEVLGRGSRSALWVALGAVVASAAAAFWLSNAQYAASPFAGQFSVTPAVLMAKGALLALAVPLHLLALGRRGGVALAGSMLSLSLRSNDQPRDWWPQIQAVWRRP